MFGEHSPEIWSFLGGLISGGVGGSLLTFRLTRTNKVSGSGSVADQSGAKAGGDIVGRDKNTTGEHKVR